MSLFVKLEVTWVDNPKVNNASLAGRGLHATALCIAKRADGDGWISPVTLYKEGATEELIEELLSLRLLEKEGDMVRPWGWLDRNLTKDQIKEVRSLRAKKANHRKWEHKGSFDECEVCNPPENPEDPKSSLNIPKDTQGSQNILNDPKGILSDPKVSLTSLELEVEVETELEIEREVEADVESEAVKKAAATAEKLASNPDVKKFLARFELKPHRQALTVFLSDERIVDRLYVWGPELSGYLDGLNTPLGKAASHSDVVTTATEVLTVRGAITPKLLRGWLARTMRGDPSGGSGDRKADGSFKTPGDRMRDRMRLTS